MIHVLAWVVVGLVAGWLATQIMGPGAYGIIGDVVIGLIGALVGGLLAALLGLGGLDKLDPFDFGRFVITVLISLVGAIIFIAVLRAIAGRRA